jgi:hypothetical protein
MVDDTNLESLAFKSPKRWPGRQHHLTGQRDDEEDLVFSCCEDMISPVAQSSITPSTTTTTTAAVAAAFEPIDLNINAVNNGSTADNNSSSSRMTMLQHQQIELLRRSSRGSFGGISSNSVSQFDESAGEEDRGIALTSRRRYWTTASSDSPSTSRHSNKRPISYHGISGTSSSSMATAAAAAAAAAAASSSATSAATNINTNTPLRKWQTRAYNFLERPRGSKAIAYHVVV